MPKTDLLKSNIDLLKSHIEAYTRKDGAVVQAHDDKRVKKPQPSSVSNAISKKHNDSLIRKGTEWDREGIKGRKIPAADVAGLPEYSHKEVYGHDGETSPAGDDFHPDFVAKHDPANHPGFVLRHKDGAKSYVDTEGAKYARYHAPVEAGEDSKPATPALNAHTKHLRAEGDRRAKDGSHTGLSDRDDFHSLASALDKGDHESAGATLKHMDTEPRDAALDHVHPAHWEKLGFAALNMDRSLARYDKLHGASAAKKPAKPAAPAKKPAAPAIKTQNEGYGFHGEAMSQHIRDKHGAGTYHGDLSEKDYNEAKEAGHKKFAEAADKLVSGGHFGSHEEARDYLDSTHGRHLHDGASFHGGDVSKVPWLAKDVKSYKGKAK